MGEDTPGVGEGVTEDTLRIKTFEDRVIVDLAEDPFSTDYVVLDERGMTITLAAQRVRLSWVSVRQLVSVISLAEKTFRHKKED
jgi:hypothetical protein